MTRFGLSSLVRKARRPSNSSDSLPPSVHDHTEEEHEEEHGGAIVSATTSNNTQSSSIFDIPVSENSDLSASSSYNNEPEQPSQPALSRRPSFESCVDTLVFSDAASSANTLLHGQDQGPSSSRHQRQYAGNWRSLPIYATRFRSGVSVYESDIAAKVSRTLCRQRRQKQKGKQPSSSLSPVAGPSSNTRALPMSDEIPMPPSLSCQVISSYNPFSSKKTPFMTIQRLGKTVRSNAFSGHPKTLLADTILHQQIELGLAQESTTSFTEESADSKPFCQVWQSVLTNDQIKYTLEFDNELDYAQPTVFLLNDGGKRVTHTSYDGVRMQWKGTTGIGSPFGSGFFELRFADQEELTNGTIAQRPPVAVYHNIGAKTLSNTRKVGEFIIWEPGFEFADIIVAMGMVLREQEQRKEIDGHRIAMNKLANF